MEFFLVKDMENRLKMILAIVNLNSATLYLTLFISA